MSLTVDKKMKRINLRDWRTERRAALTTQFRNMAILGAIVAAAIVFFVLQYFNGAISHQQSRNQMLQREITEIDRKITEIEELERVKANLLARMQVIEQLQGSRSQTVHFFDEIVKTLPDGIYLKSIRQRGNSTTLEGVAESTGRVSTYMKNLDASPWFDNPRLIVIKTQEADGRRGRQGDFTLQIKNVIATEESADDSGGRHTVSARDVIDEINGLDLNNPGSWPDWTRYAAVILIMVAIIGAGTYFFVKPKLGQLDSAKAQERSLRVTFEQKQRKIANLDAYKEQLEEMRRSFGAMLRQLPNKTEVANLLLDISQERVASGLEEELFQPQSEIKKEFYAEIPNKIQVVGSYGEMGEFVSGVAALPRIVTIDEVEISPVSGRRGQRGVDRNFDGELRMQALAKTYRYLDDSELDDGEDTP